MSGQTLVVDGARCSRRHEPDRGSVIDHAGAPGRPGERRRLARAMDIACREIGFFAITGLA
jgi:hypothetical protein